MSPAVTMDRKDAEYEINSELFNRSFENLEDRILAGDFNGLKKLISNPSKKLFVVLSENVIQCILYRIPH